MMKTPIIDFVREYAEGRTARLHMPGHKGQDITGVEKFDITEINGADELYAADGIIEESENNVSALFGSAHSYYSAEGSTLAIKAMLTLAASERPSGERPLFVAARNAHKAFVYGAAMLDADVEWVYSEKGHICKCVITPSDVERAIGRCPRKPDGVYLTSPDYLGNIADVKGIAQICDRLGVPLLVDNAHGAYLAFLEENRHPMALGASMCADSAHKTLPVITGGAYLHVAPKARHFCASARSAMAMYASTSPSYLILQSLDACNKYLSQSAGQGLKSICEYVENIKARLLKKRIVTEGDEPIKIVINATASGYEGGELAKFFRQGGVEPEFCDCDYLVLMLSEFNTEAEREALSAIVDSLEGKNPLEREAVKAPECCRAMSIREAVFAPFESVPVNESEGRICASPTVSCPPAVPVAVSGEVISDECAKAFLHYGITHVSVVKK